MMDSSSELGVYRDREHAGAVLGEQLEAYRGADVAILAIPNGGVPVGIGVRASLGGDLDVLVVRKLHIPWNPEAGFGAVAPDGTVVFNDPLRSSLGLSAREERAIISAEIDAVHRRIEMYQAKPLRTSGRIVILVDDGLASGYSMLAAIRYVRRTGARSIVVAVPTASQRAVELVALAADKVIVPNVRRGLRFAVADAYRSWRDLEDHEVLDLLRIARSTHGSRGDVLTRDSAAAGRSS